MQTAESQPMQTAESQPIIVLIGVIATPPRTVSGYVGKTGCGSQDRDAAEVESSYALTNIHKIFLDQHPPSSTQEPQYLAQNRIINTTP